MWARLSILMRFLSAPKTTRVSTPQILPLSSERQHAPLRPSKCRQIQSAGSAKGWQNLAMLSQLNPMMSLTRARFLPLKTNVLAALKISKKR